MTVVTTAVATLRLTAYRTADQPLLTGHWPVGELLGLPCPGRPQLAAPNRLDPPTDSTAEVCVVRGVAAVRLDELDWVSRRGRLQIGFRPATVDHVVEVLHLALLHARDVLNLGRVYGWTTPDAYPGGAWPELADVLSAAGLDREAVVPEAGWHDGRAVAREIWGSTS